MMNNNFGMNPMMGMNPMFGMNNNMNNQINSMNNMDSTTQNVKNIIEPYEMKIKQLEEILFVTMLSVIYYHRSPQKYSSNFINVLINKNEYKYV